MFYNLQKHDSHLIFHGTEKYNFKIKFYVKKIETYTLREEIFEERKFCEFHELVLNSQN